MTTPAPMLPAMTAAEITLLSALLRCADSYLEFGAGGSTCLAAELVRSTVISLDSSTDWLARVEQQVRTLPRAAALRLVHADIGPVGGLGYPTDPASAGRWPAYHERVWDDPAACDADLFLVDGRFRVACFAQAVLHAKPGALVVIHDFAGRPEYHPVRTIAREVACAEQLSVFLPLPTERAAARRLLEAHRQSTY